MKIKIIIHKTIDFLFFWIQLPRWIIPLVIYLLLGIVSWLGNKSEQGMDWINSHGKLWISHRKIRVWLSDDREFMPNSESPISFAGWHAVNIDGVSKSYSTKEIYDLFGYKKERNGRWSRLKTGNDMSNNKGKYNERSRHI